MLGPRRQRPLAALVAAALVRGETDASETEVALVEDSVAHSLDAMPDFLTIGVRGVALVSSGVLFLLGRGPFHSQPADRQVRLAETLAALPGPGLAEFARLTRGLGLVSLYEGRDDVATARQPVENAAG